MRKEKLIKQYKLALEKMPSDIKIADKDIEYDYKGFKFVLRKDTRVINATDDFIAMYYYLLKTLEKELSNEEFRSLTNGTL